MWRDLSSTEKRKALRLLIVGPAILVSYLCLVTLPLLWLVLVGAKSGQALSASAVKTSFPALLAAPFVIGFVSALVGLLVSPGWKLRIAALPSALGYSLALWFVLGR